MKLQKKQKSVKKHCHYCPPPFIKNTSRIPTTPYATCYLWNLCCLLLYWAVMLASSAWGEGLNMHIKTSPPQPGQGEAILLTITSTFDNTPTSLLFQGKTLNFQPCPRDLEPISPEATCYFTLLPIPLNMTPGSHNITIHISKAGHMESLIVPVHIISKHYPEEHLTVEQKMVEFPEETLTRIKEEQQAMVAAMSHETNLIYWTPWFHWPVSSEIKSPFGLRRFFNGQPRAPHAGIDLKGAVGDPVRAANNGRVIFVKDCYLSGNTIIIDHGYGLYSIYCHLSKTYVTPEEEVQKDQIIGEVGKTGRATGAHLHWGISLHGVRIDPQSLMRLLGGHTSKSIP